MKEISIEQLLKNLEKITEDDLVAAQERLRLIQRLNNSGKITNIKLQMLMQDRERALSIYETATAEALELLKYNSIYLKGDK